ncbi:hypothetical protein [Bradyrhizobium sp. Leo121]|uniref:hypothetical protein n=1 Tax=Bradyrhizobium sp. Leo121 TaxID=1571195 RepID=UPI0013EEF5F6|nr:hypothetical protein [Bradyrhizobium sp. Leo121]
MSAAIHLRLGLVEIARIEGRENLVALTVGQHAGTVNVLLVAGATFSATQRARKAQHVLSVVLTLLRHAESTRWSISHRMKLRRR